MSFTSQDLLLAQEVQNAAIPPFAPPLDGLTTAMRAISAQDLGGDFHLFLRLNNERKRQRAGLVVGDVSGKGLPASLIATSIGHFFPLLDPLRDPAQALRTLNEALLERTPMESYASLVLAETDVQSDLLRIWSAGHPPALLWRAATGQVDVALTGNPLLGCFPDWSGVPQEWFWEENDVLVLYSDGLIETRNLSGQMFEIAGVTEILRQRGTGTVDEIADALMEGVHGWGKVTDDATVIVSRRTRSMLPAAVEPSPVRVLLVDDHCIWRDGMRSLLLGTEFQVVGEAASGQTALELIRRTSPDLVLLDIRMAGGDGLEALSGIMEQGPQTKVMMLTTYDHPHYKARALAGGAAGYLLKGTPRDEMLLALRTIMCGGTTQTDREKALTSALRSATNVAESPDADDLTTPLTGREVEVLKLLSTGMSNHSIGERLFISEGTVKTHVEHIINKVGVSDRVQAAVWAARHGIAPEIPAEGAEIIPNKTRQ